MLLYVQLRACLKMQLPVSDMLTRGAHIAHFSFSFSSQVCLEHTGFLCREAPQGHGRTFVSQHVLVVQLCVYVGVAALVQSLVVALMLHDGECVAQRHGTCEDTLMRVLVSRSEVDLKKILEEYSVMYDMSLQEHIQVRVSVPMVPAGKRTH